MASRQRLMTVFSKVADAGHPLCVHAERLISRAAAELVERPSPGRFVASATPIRLSSVSDEAVIDRARRTERLRLLFEMNEHPGGIRDWLAQPASWLPPGAGLEPASSRTPEAPAPAWLPPSATWA